MGDIGLILCAGLILLAVLSLVSQLKKGDDDRLAQRLKGELKTREQVQADRALLLNKEQAKTLLDQILGRFKIVERVQKMLDQADIDFRASNLIGITLMVSLAILIAGLLAINKYPIIPFAAACVPSMVVWYGLGFMVRRRRNKFVEQMPDAFDLMVQCLRAGYALPGAIGNVGEQAADPLGKEFSRMYAEQNLGKRLEDAMRDMAERIDAMDVKMFVSAVLIQRTTGGDLAEVLEKISTLIRDRIELFGQVAALTAEGRLSGWVLLSLPPGCLIYCMAVNPNYIAPLFDTTEGNFLLMAAGLMMLGGMAMIKKIITIEV